MLTLAFRSLHHTCNALIAIASFFDIIVELHAPLGLFFASFYFNSLFMSVRLCWYINIMAEFSLNSSLILALMIGIDRMLSIVAPMA
uniref:G-protein coupled receptors family 1 profile domain-containing protein n=1 Tax=Acrobeloides nanus TaxID=290746 RepID=A0A914EG77_9BILA